MAYVKRKTQLEIYEVETEDGGIGLQFGADEDIHLGYDRADLMSLLAAAFSLDPEQPEDTDLTDLTSQYLDPDWAEARREYLRGLA